MFGKKKEVPMAGNNGIPCARCGYLRATHDATTSESRPTLIEGWVCERYTPVAAVLMAEIDHNAANSNVPGRWERALSLADMSLIEQHLYVR